MTIQITLDSSDVVPQEHQVQVQVQAQVTAGLSPSSCNTEYIIFVANVPHRSFEIYSSKLKYITEFNKSDVITHRPQGNLRLTSITYVSSADMITKQTKQCDVFPCNSSSV